MKSLFSLLMLLPLTLAAKTCTSNGPQSPTPYKLTISADSSALATLSETFSAAGKNVSISEVLDSSNRALTSSKPPIGNGKPTVHLAWNSGDENTAKWLPQGITSSADADTSGKWEGREAFIVSWHQDDDSNARVSFVDRATNKYRHVYLVRPDGESFGSVGVHAGGIVWYQQWLYVVDTSVGVRVFDLGNLWEVSIGDGLGKQSDGSYVAENYRYVLPQIQYVSSLSFPFELRGPLDIWIDGPVLIASTATTASAQTMAPNSGTATSRSTEAATPQP
jgi:hypothetical protein